MKLKTTQNQDPTSTSSGTVIADRFKLDVPEVAAQSSGSKVGAAIALVCSLISIVLLGATAWMIYQNLDLIQNV